MLQRLNLTAPARNPPDSPAQATTGSHESIHLNPAKGEEVTRRTKEIIASGMTPEWLFVCKSGGSLPTFQHAPNKKPAMLLFTTPFAAQDYIRATGTGANVGQLKVESLPEPARMWLSSGSDVFILNRCPRCKVFLLGAIKVLLSKEHFVACRAADRGKIRVWRVIGSISNGTHRRGVPCRSQSGTRPDPGSYRLRHPLCASDDRVDRGYSGDEAARAA